MVKQVFLSNKKMKFLNRELYNVKELLDSDWLIFTRFHLIGDENDCQLSQEIRVQWQRRRNTSFLQKHENFRIVELLELTLWNYWNGCFSLTLTIISE